jgi:catechol 2,3-dioxygenase-like lactoylglutathione lyase family enzyme
MLASSPVMTFVATKDSARSRDFYENLLGLKFVVDTQYALVFDLLGTMLRIQKVQALPVVNHTVLGWMVTDIKETVKALAAKGIHFERYSFLPQDPLGIWTTPDGAGIAWFKDPDGNVLSLTQF